jgi:K+-transporting ATPase KdpF subunit
MNSAFGTRVALGVDRTLRGLEGVGVTNPPSLRSQLRLVSGATSSLVRAQILFDACYAETSGIGVPFHLISTSHYLWILRSGFRDYLSADLFQWVRASSSWWHAKRSNREQIMIYVTAGVSLFLFVYLFVALIRPEWF